MLTSEGIVQKDIMFLIQCPRLSERDDVYFHLRETKIADY